MNQSEVTIDNRLGKSLQPEDNQLLKAMFRDYQGVILKKEFLDGNSSSRVILVRPIGRDGIKKRPNVIKFDYAYRIKIEYNAFLRNVQGNMSFSVEVEGKPVFLPTNPYGALRYKLVGGGTFEISSLLDFIFDNDTAKINTFLDQRLFRNIKQFWKDTTQGSIDLYIKKHYDAVLPVNLTILTGEPASESRPRWFHPDTVYSEDWPTGSPIQVSGFQVVHLNFPNKQLWLDLPNNEGQGCRFHISPIENLDQFEIGQVINRPITGVIQSTRGEQLDVQARAVLGYAFDLKASIVEMSDGSVLPNPLYRLPSVLNQSIDANVSGIHGDLHLENILVEDNNAYIIDFAHAKVSHTLKDLIKMETAVITQVLPNFLGKSRQTPDVILQFYEQLHCVLASSSTARPERLEKPFAIILQIRQIASEYLYDKSDWSEYYYGLFVYLLGSLRYSSLDKIKPFNYPKQLAFWGAATVLNIVDQPPICEEKSHIKDEGDIQQSPQNTSSGNTTTTHINGPVNGQIHTGEGDNIQYEARESPLATTPSTQETASYNDIYAKYEQAAQQILQQLDSASPSYVEAESQQMLLDDNIDRSRRFGETNARRSERAEIIEQLSRISHSILGISFYQLLKKK